MSCAVETVQPTRRDFAQLLKLFREGDPDASREFLRLYTPVLRETVRRRLPIQMRTEFESLDFVQEVWAAVCGEAARTRDFETEASLQSYLTRVACNRVTDAYRHRTSQRASSGVPDQALPVIVAGSDPTPSQWAIAGERWEAIAATLPAPHVIVIERLRDGFTQQEISNLTGIPLRTISRIVQRVQRQCEETHA